MQGHKQEKLAQAIGQRPVRLESSERDTCVRREEGVCTPTQMVDVSYNGKPFKSLREGG